MAFHHKGRTIYAVQYTLDTGGSLYVALNANGEHDYGTVKHGDPTKRVVQLNIGDTVTGNFGSAVVVAVKPIEQSNAMGGAHRGGVK